MPEIYYTDEHVTLYHGDCLTEHREWLAADVLVTDPPYGMAYVSHASSYKAGIVRPPTAPIAGDENAQLRDDILAAWGDRPALVFGTWRVPRPPAARALVVWDKGDSPGTGALDIPWGPSHEEVYVLGRGFVGKRRGGGAPRYCPVVTGPTPRRAPHAEAPGAHGDAHRRVPARRDR